ncbi:acyl carrier protein, partial [Streptomyces sp. O3]
MAAIFEHSTLERLVAHIASLIPAIPASAAEPPTAPEPAPAPTAVPAPEPAAAPAAETPAPTAETPAPDSLAWQVRELVAQGVGLSAEEIEPVKDFAAYGIDSIVALRIMQRLQARFG